MHLHIWSIAGVDIKDTKTSLLPPSSQTVVAATELNHCQVLCVQVLPQACGQHIAKWVKLVYTYSWQQGNATVRLMLHCDTNPATKRYPLQPVITLHTYTKWKINVVRCNTCVVPDTNSLDKKESLRLKVSVQMRFSSSIKRFDATESDQLTDFCLACELMVRQSLSQMGS